MGGLMVQAARNRCSWGKSDLGKHSLCIASLVLFVSASGFAQTNVSAGNVSGTWRLANSPYHINGDITIPNDSTLTIEPRVKVVFTGHYKFNVQGRLLAVGSRQDSIYFTAENTATGWHGIRFMNTPNTNDTSKMIYCSFTHGKANTGSGFDQCGGAILIHSFDKVFISDCLFDSNVQSGESWVIPYEAGPAIYFIYCSPVITKSTFSNNVGHKSGAIVCLYSPSAIISHNVLTLNKGMFGPIVCEFNGSPTISDNIIFNNLASYGPGGILVYNGATPTIERNVISYNLAGGIGVIYNSTPWVLNNIIVHNYDCGVACWDSSNAVLINNTIAYNGGPRGGGIVCDGNSDPILINTILYNNTAPSGNQVNITDGQSDPHFVYCDIQGGMEGFAGYGAGANYSGTYINNIDADPKFVDAASNDFGLSDSSGCIGAGEFTAKVAGVYYHPPTFDIMGNPRPSPSGSRPDIGACENPRGNPTDVRELDASIPTSYALEQNYPNPFNPSTTIRYGLSSRSHVTLTVFNMLGQEVAPLINGDMGAGYHEVKFDASRLSSGVYMYRIQAGDFVQTRKLLLVR